MADERSPAAAWRLIPVLLVGLVTLAVLWAAAGSVVERRCQPWSEGTSCGAWRLAYNGYGSAIAVHDAEGWRYELRPRAALRPEETHAALAVSNERFDDLDVSVSMRTSAQLRRPPNPWEAAWLVWHYTDDLHFYYLVLKPNGWEVGKEDPVYSGAQRFLATDSRPTFPVGQWSFVRIHQTGGDIRISVDGTEIARVIDTERPYTHGSVGLYTEDAAVQFRDPDIEPISAARDTRKAGA